MAAPTRYATASPSHYDQYDELERGFDTELSAGERTEPLPPRRSRVFSRLMLVLSLGLGGAWAYWGDTAPLMQWLPPEIAALLPPALRDAASPSPPATLAAANPEPEIPLPTLSPIMSLEQAPPPSMTAALPAETAPKAEGAADAPAHVDVIATAEPAATDEAATKTGEAEAPPERLPPPVVDLSDPYQRKATAVGLHPELSRALLEKLSAADYKNAGLAIRTALAQTPDSDVYVWPRERKGGQAIFQVKFVPGAPADCRRYVVAIVKDGWQTTALPMERCGMPPPRERSARVSPALEKVRSSAP